MKQSVVLFGEWNTTNLGDQAIGHSAADFFSSSGYNVELFSFGSLSYIGTNLHPTDLDEIFNSENVQRNGNRVKLRRFSRFLAFGKKVRANLAFLRLLPYVRESSAIIVGGGELLNSNHKQFEISLHMLTRLAGFYDKPLICIGCSLSRNTNQNNSTLIKFTRACDLLAVRDQYTKTILSTYRDNTEIQIFGDCTMKNKLRKQEIKTSYRIGINIKSEFQAYQVYEKYIQSIVSELQKIPDYELVFFTTGNYHDFLMARNLAEEFQKVEVFHPSSIASLSRFYEEIDITLAGRLHSAILSMNDGIPTLGLEFETKKLNDFFSLLGLENQVMPLSQDPKSLVSRISDFLVPGNPQLAAQNEAYAILLKEQEAVKDSVLKILEEVKAT